MSVEVGAGLLPSAEHWTDSTSQQAFFCGCADEKECAGQLVAVLPPCADSVGGDEKVSAGQPAVNNIPTTLLRGMESRSAVHAAVHDRITTTKHDVRFVW